MQRLTYSRLSIKQRLPLLMCALLLSVILIFGLISYVGVKQAALKVGNERLQSLSGQLSTMLTGNTRSFISSTHAVASKPAIQKFLLSNGKDSAAESLKLLQELRKDSLYTQVELRNAERSQVLISAKGGVSINVNTDSLLLSFASSSRPDSGKVGKLYGIGNTVYYPIVATVMEETKLIGYIIRWRMMNGTPKALEQLSQLIGTDAKLYIGNADGTLWTDMIRPVSFPSLEQQNKTGLIEYTGSGKNKVMASVRPIGNSIWLVAVEFSKKKVLEATNRFLYWLIIAGSVLLILGIFVAWLMSRKISGPLRKLTTAAAEIAAGNYSSLVHVERYDELGKLARAFNAMSVQVQNSQKELEKKAQNYKLLFERNPMPMWIISNPGLNVIDVNEAAVIHYGYSREEFLQLNSKDLRPEEDLEKYLAYMSKGAGGYSTGIWRHKKKNGSMINVDVIADDILYKGQQARLILANDITEKLRAEAELVRHRIMRQELITETTIQVQEKEREELGKELHDNINQILASTKLYLELARSGNNELLPEALSKSYENVNLAIGEIRQLSKQLVPPSLGTTLVEATTELIEEIETITLISISLTAENFNESLLNENIKLMIYRVIQEQINNIVKHASATEVSINIETAHGIVYLVITDNGIGFDTNKKSKGIGLRNIDNRVKFYEGFSSITSQPGKGCRLEISVPLQKAKFAI
jgi:PAS domain S-box-containing protein